MPRQGHKSWNRFDEALVFARPFVVVGRIGVDAELDGVVHVACPPDVLAEDLGGAVPLLQDLPAAGVIVMVGGGPVSRILDFFFDASALAVVGEEGDDGTVGKSSARFLLIPLGAEGIRSPGPLSSGRCRGGTGPG